MTDRPILFNAPMVRALLDGRKTQTRRLISTKGHANLFSGEWADSYVMDPENASWRDRHVRFAIGDLIWVRESGIEGLRPRLFKIFVHDATPGRYWVDSDGGRYGASYGPAITRESMIKSGGWKVRPSIHMPRWASRLTLTVTDVRVQRLQDISEEDAEAEGCPPCPECHGCGWINSGPDGGWQCTRKGCGDSYGEDYHQLWESLNGTGSWAKNPWVVAISFECRKGNIDDMAEGIRRELPSQP